MSDPLAKEEQRELEYIQTKMEERDEASLNDTVNWLKEHQKGQSSVLVKKEEKMYEAVGDPMDHENMDLHHVLGECVHEGNNRPDEYRLSPDEVRRQLDALQFLDKKIKEADESKRSSNAVYDTISWLKQHECPSETTPKNSKSFLHSIMEYIYGSNKVSQKEADKQMVPLSPNWGSETLKVPYYNIGFMLLNEPFRVDMMNVRKAILTGCINRSTPEHLAHLVTWLTSFDHQLKMANQLKLMFLTSCSELTHFGFKLSTLFEKYDSLLLEAIRLSKVDRELFGAKIIQCFGELEACLRDEEEAIGNLLNQCFHEESMFDALSTFLMSIGEDCEGGIVVAKILGWISTVMNLEERKAFVHCLPRDTQLRLGGLWMRHYANYLMLLEPFGIEYQSSVVYSRSRAELTK